MISFDEADDPTREHMWDGRHDLLRRIRLGVHYHRKRERYFELLDKAAKAIALIGTSSVMASIATGASSVVTQSVIVVSSTLALVLDFSSKARDHSDMAVRYSMLDRDVSAVGIYEFTDRDLAQWESRFCDIEAVEPPTIPGLIQLCQDEMEFAADHDVPQDRLSLKRRILAHLGFGDKASST